MKHFLLICTVLLAAVTAHADFTPTHPFVYMDAADIAVMQDNVLVKKYPWAVNLYNKAKQSARSGSWERMPKTYNAGKDMIGCALVYLIDGDVNYAEGAKYWLNLFRNNYDPDDDTPYSGSYSLGKIYHFNPNQVLVPVAYDLLYNYLAETDPGNLAQLTTYIDWFAGRCSGSMDHNENQQEWYAEGICGYVLGKQSYIDRIENGFRSWYEGGTTIGADVWGGFHYEAEHTQGMKHYGYVIESQIHYILAAHKAAKHGYTSWDPDTWRTSKGWNVIEHNWRFLAKKSTPLFQVPYETMWRGNLFHMGNCTGMASIALNITGDEEWQAVAATYSEREVQENQCTNTYWAGLSHGREITGTPRFRNESVSNNAIGKHIIFSGDPAGHTEPATSLQAYMMAKRYGEVPLMNLKLYGKGKKINAAPLEKKDDSWGMRGSGGSCLVTFDHAPEITESYTVHAWDVTDPVIKVMSCEKTKHHRAVAVTDDYFVDVYEVNADGKLTWDFHGLGPANSAPSATGSVTGNFTCTWPDHLKMYVFQDGTSDVSMATMTNVPWMETGVPGRRVNPIYTTEVIRKLRMRRHNVVGSTRFINVMEPLGQGAVLSTVERFNTTNTGAVTGFKITADTYTDYFFYNDGTGTHTLTRGSETITINGRWGFVRKNHSGSIVVRGSVTNHNIPGTPVAGTVATPSISPAGGGHSGSVEVSITCATAGADIHYTTDGSDPTSSSTEYTGAFTLSSSATVKAIGIKSGDDDSHIASQTFTVTTPTVATPVINPAGGYFDSIESVSITCADAGASVYYTTDGTNPTAASTEYTGAIELTATTTIKAIGSMTGKEDSPVVSAIFTLGAMSLLEDDFEGGASLTWAPKTSANWSVDADDGDDAYHINTTDIAFDYHRPGEYSLLEHGTFTAFGMEVDGRTPDNGSADLGFVFGWQDYDNHYYVSFSKYGPNSAVYQVAGGKRTSLLNFNEALAGADYRTYRMTLEEGAMTFYVDGVEKGAVTEAVPEGKVGLQTLNDEVYFDNFRLTMQTGVSGIRNAGIDRSIRIRPAAGAGIGLMISLIKPAAATVTVYGVNGAYRTVCHSGILDAGTHRVQCDVPAGIYIMRAEVGGTVYAVKAVAVK